MAAARSRTARIDGPLPAVMGFALVAVPAALMVGWLLVQPLPHVVLGDGAGGAEGEPALAEAAAPLPLQYIDLPEPLSVAAATDQQRVQVTLAVAIRAEMEKLLPLQTAVEDQAQRISARMLEEAQEMVGEGASVAQLHDALPERLRAVINAALGTEDWPEPVEEVLITGMVVQG